MQENRHIFTLNQVAKSIQKTITDRYNSSYWIQAEMHKLNFTSKGHCYPELVHKEKDLITTEMRATIWRSNFERISKNFAEIVKEPIRDGMYLLFLAKIQFHPLYGVGLEIIDIDPTFSLGELEKERKETLLKLEKEGILNANQKLEFPLLPKRLAIISISTSKGYSDFISVLNSQQDRFSIFTMLFEAQLNGDAAIKSIQNQLEKIKRVKSHFDVVLIIRGGGGEIGMSCYNNYQLAKTIATFPLPILTGIGHSTNLTVSEMVAYRNAITPTELADLILTTFYDFQAPLLFVHKTLKSVSENIFTKTKNELRNKLRLSEIIFKNRIKKEKSNLRFNSLKIKQAISLKFIHEKNTNKQIITKLRNEIQFYFASKFKTNKEFNLLLIRNFNNLINNEKTKLNLIQTTINVINPENLLKKGYTITTYQGKILTEHTLLKIGDKITTISEHLTVYSNIQKIEKNEKK